MPMYVAVTPDLNNLLSVDNTSAKMIYLKFGDTDRSEPEEAVKPKPKLGEDELFDDRDEEPCADNGSLPITPCRCGRSAYSDKNPCLVFKESPSAVTAKEGHYSSKDIQKVVLGGDRGNKYKSILNALQVPLLKAHCFEPASDKYTEWYKVYLHKQEHLDNVKKLIDNFSKRKNEDVDNPDFFRFGEGVEEKEGYTAAFFEDVKRILALLTSEMSVP